jgi:hypothetical protein
MIQTNPGPNCDLYAQRFKTYLWKICKNPDSNFEFNTCCYVRDQPLWVPGNVDQTFGLYAQNESAASGSGHKTEKAQDYLLCVVLEGDDRPIVEQGMVEGVGEQPEELHYPDGLQGAPAVLQAEADDAEAADRHAKQQQIVFLFCVIPCSLSGEHAFITSIIRVLSFARRHGKIKARKESVSLVFSVENC